MRALHDRDIVRELTPPKDSPVVGRSRPDLALLMREVRQARAGCELKMDEAQEVLSSQSSGGLISHGVVQPRLWVRRWAAGRRTACKSRESADELSEESARAYAQIGFGWIGSAQHCSASAEVLQDHRPFDKASAASPESAKDLRDFLPMRGVDAVRFRTPIRTMHREVMAQKSRLQDPIPYMELPPFGNLTQ